MTNHYSGQGNAAADGCGMMVIIGLGILVLIVSGFLIGGAL